LIGKKISHYEVTGFLGKGGMGEVYRARDTRLDREVALKVLPAEFSRDSDRLARFRREARMLASLNHPNIAAIHGLEETDEGTFLIMELAQGLDLSERLRSGPLELDDTLKVARQLAEGLESAHEKGVVHRDLKPANLKITPTGDVKILDFGLARAFLGDDDGPNDPLNSPTMTAGLTQQGMILGTAAYMSPEQARGRPVDHRSDIWAFGAILFEMLTGRRLFEGETISDTVAAVLRADLDWDLLPEDTPTGVRRLLMRCLERDARRRLRDIGEARVRLERWQEDPSAIHESTAMFSSDLTQMPGRRPWLTWALGLVAAVAVLMLGLNLMRGPKESSRILSFEIDVPGEESIDAYTRNNVLLSNDGNMLGWVTAKGIYVRNAGDREAQLLDGTENTMAAAFSPDGNWVAFVTRNRLQRISIAGGAPFDICEALSVRGLAWVDDESLVFPNGITTGLTVVSIADGVPRTLTTTDPTRNERSHRWPTPVPGRRAVLFECQYLGRDYDQSDIQMVDLDGGERRTIHRGAAAPVATADGHLLFVRGSNLYAMAFDAKSGEVRGLPVPVQNNVSSSVGNQEDDDGSAQYAVDHQGGLFYLDSGGAQNELSQLVLLDIITGDTKDIGTPDIYRDLLMSPDGRLLALSKGPTGEEDLYIIDLSSGNETLLTRRPSVEYLGAWSPDSRLLYWTQGSDDGTRFEVWRRRVDGATPAEHVMDMPAGSGAWVSDISPDDRTLLITIWQGAELYNIYSLDLTAQDAELTPYIIGSENYWGAQFLAGGDYVIYKEDISGDTSGSRFNVFLRRFPDTGAVWSFVGPPEGYRASWWFEPLGGVVAKDDQGFALLPLTINEDGVVLDRPVRHRFTGNDHDLGPVWAASIDGDRPLLACLEAEDDEEAQAGTGPSLVYIAGWGQQMAAKVDGPR